MDQAEKTPDASKPQLSDRVAQILAEAKPAPKAEVSPNPNKLIRPSKKLFAVQDAEPVTVEVTAPKMQETLLRPETLAEMQAGRDKLAHHQAQHQAARLAQEVSDEKSLNQQVETNREFIPNMSQRANPA